MAIGKTILGRHTAKPPHREIQKTAIGATESGMGTHRKCESVVLKYKTRLQDYYSGTNVIPLT